MRRVIVPFFLLLFFLVLFSVVALAYPEVGHQFYGYAGSGSTVTAEVGDLTYTTAVQSDEYYGYDSIFFVDAASDDMDGAEEGDTITFYLDDTEVTTATFEIGGVTKLDFADDPATAEDESVDTSSSDSDSDSDSDSSDSDSDSDSDSSSDDDSSSSSSGHSSSSSSSSSGSGKGCFDQWDCQSWNSCASNSFQTRICYYEGNCTTEGGQPDTRQSCTYVAPEEETTVVSEKTEATCYDGIKNQGERGVDCGGPCDVCTVTTVVEETKTNWLYVGLGIFIILLIIAIILAHKYKDKLHAWWDKVRGKKPGTSAAAVTAGAKQAATFQRPAYQQQYQYRPQQQYVKK